MRAVNLWQAFESTATRFAERPAVEMQRADSVERWTYRELHDAAVVQAEWLVASGVAAGDRCAILADNDAAWCATYLAIFRAGGVAVPLDTNYSAAQVATIVRDATPRVLFVNDRLIPIAHEAVEGRADIAIVPITPTTSSAQRPQGTALLKGTPVPVSGTPVAVDSPASSISTVLPVGTPGTQPGKEDPAVILYTSGTTADPKGVVLSHGNLMAEREAVFAILKVSETDSVLGVLPLFHALAQLANLLLPFMAGARVVFLETVNSTELVRALSSSRITIFACVPQFFYLIHQRVMAQVASGGLPKRLAFRWLLALNFTMRRAGVNIGARLFRRVHDVMGRQMRLFVVGGSKFDPSVGRDLYSLGFTILQAYGLTETSGAATITTPDEAHIDTVGRVLPGHGLRIVPSDDPDVDGEIAIRGPIVMQGYFNRPDVTRAVMNEDWFLTGDLGRLDADGRLTITGRKKEVIILASGKNIYPEEVESYYGKSQFVKEVCVLGLARDDEPTTERLFAVVVPDLELMRQRRIANAGDLIRFEMEGQSIHLPPHKRVLGYDVWLEPLPRTTTGKLKRHEIARRLKQKRHDATQLAAQPTAVLPQWAADEHANAAVEVIARRGKGRAVLPSSNLELDLGLDSMERVELLTELEQRFGVRVPEDRAHDVLTVEQLIEAVRPGASVTQEVATADSWAVLLRDLPPTSDPVLGSLLQPRLVSAPVVFAVLRLLRFLMPRVEVSGLQHLPPSGPYIISPNHQGYLDPFFLCSVLPYRVLKQLFFVGAAEYFETPITAWLARQCNLVPVDPDANLVPAMKAGAFGLAHGKILVLFPEGERSIDGTVKRFKKGAPILSRHLQVPIVPTAIHGVFDIWPRNRRINWRLLFPWTAHRVQVSFGAPAAPTAERSDGEVALALQNTVRAMWDELERSHQQRQQKPATAKAADRKNA